MRQGLCNGTVSVRLSVSPSVCPSVCPSYRPLQQHAAGLLLWARWARDIDRLLHGHRRLQQARRAAAAGTQQHGAPQHGGQQQGGQCHVYSRRRRLNTDLLWKAVDQCCTTVYAFTIFTSSPVREGEVL